MPKLDNPKHEKFCIEWANLEHLGNGVKAYCIAFDIDMEDTRKYNSARVKASDLLTKVNIYTRIDEILGDMGLNDQVVDKELLKVIMQIGDMSSKVKAIAEYNKLRSRIEEKKKISHTIDYKVKFDNTVQPPSETEGDTPSD